MNHLNKKLAELSGEYSEGYFDKNPNNVPDYLNDWNLLMPLAVVHQIDMQFFGNRTFASHEGMYHKYSGALQEATVKCLIAKLEGE